MKYILGKKKMMTQVFNDRNDVVPVTIVEAGPCVVTQVADNERRGYTAVQLGFGFTKRLRKPQRGHLNNVGSFRHLREIRFKLPEDQTNLPSVGASIDVTQFSQGDIVRVQGKSIGRGFQGVVKRHGFAGSPKTHGHKDQLRHSGSIGAGGIQKVFKGLRMGGRMGGGLVTVEKLEVIRVDAAKNELWVKGAIPGARNGLVVIQSMN